MKEAIHSTNYIYQCIILCHYISDEMGMLSRGTQRSWPKNASTDPSRIIWGLGGYIPQVLLRGPSGQGLDRAWACPPPLLGARGLARALGSWSMGSTWSFWPPDLQHYPRLKLETNAPSTFGASPALPRRHNAVNHCSDRVPHGAWHKGMMPFRRLQELGVFRACLSAQRAGCLLHHRWCTSWRPVQADRAWHLAH